MGCEGCKEVKDADEEAEEDELGTGNVGFFSAASDSGNKRTHKPPKSSVCF